MPTLEELKADLVAARKDAETKAAAAEATLKSLGEKQNEMEKRQADIIEEHKAASKRVDDVLLALSKPGVVPGNAGDVKGAEVAKSAFNKFLRRLDHTMTNEEKALVLADSASGGFLIPAERSPRMIEKIVEISPVRRLATVMQTNVDHLEMVRETGDLAASWTAEQGTLTENTDTKFALEKIPVHAQNALIKVSRQMLADSPMDLETYLFNKAAAKFGKAEGAAFLTGSGVTRPQGLLFGSILSGVTSTDGASGQFTPDDILDAEAALEATYAKNAVWLMARATLNFARKFKDNDGAYLGLVGLDVLKQTQGGGRGMLLDGYSVEEAVDMTAMAASAKAGVFGNIAEAYTIVDRANMIVIRDPYSSKATGLVDFLFERRVGGQVVQPAAAVYLACAA